MKGVLRERPARTLAGVAIACLTAAWALGEVIDRHGPAGHDLQQVSHMTSTTKTVCVGRFLIDLPIEAQVSLDKARIVGLDIAAFEESRDQFLDNLTERQRQIESTPDRNGGDRNMESVRDLKTAAGLEGKMFMHSRTVTEGTAARGLEIEHYRYDGIAVEAMLHGQGVTIELSAKNYNPDLVENLSRLVDLAVPNPKERPPSGPGFCVNKAYFRDPLSADQNESIMMAATLPSHPDIEFTLILMAGLKPDKETLLDRRTRSSLIGKMIDRMWISTLRAAPRQIGSITGDEVAERVTEENNTFGYTFKWEANGTEQDVLSPYLSFLMMTGRGSHVSVPSSLSERGAIELWDRVVSSIRHRPSGMSGNAAIVPPEVALGTRALAGERCVQSGWWDCSDGGNGVDVLGGRRQRLHQGNRMPQALLLPAQGFWQRLRGLQPSFESEVPTVWKLADRRDRDRTSPALLLAEPVPLATKGTGEDGEAEPSMAIGTLVSSGRTCPASGWWRSEDLHALDGTRWFASGSTLPNATFYAEPKWFGRRSDGMPSTERRTAWRLVRADVLVDQAKRANACCENEDANSHPSRLLHDDGEG